MKSPWTTVVLLAVVCLSALLLRIAYFSTTEIERPITADARQYVVYGYNLANHGTFSQDLPSEELRPDSYRSPGYPLLIALGFLLGGEEGFYDFIIYAQILISSVAVLLTYATGVWFLPRPWAVAAALLVAVSPHQVSMTSYLLTETLFCLTLILSVLCFAHAARSLRAPWLLLAGVLFGAAYLTNEVALLIPYLFAGVILLARGRRGSAQARRRLLARMGLFLIVFSLFPAGWMLRNAINVRAEAPRGTQRVVATLSHGAYPGFMHENPEFKYFPYREDPMQPRFSSSLADFGAILWERIKERPGRYLAWYLLEKPYYLWSWNILQGQGDVYVYPVTTSLYQSSGIAQWTRLGMRILHPAILLLALGGFPLLYVTLRREGAVDLSGQTPLWVALVGIYFTSVHVLAAPWPRYSIPLRPELYLFALWAFVSARPLLRGRTERQKWPRWKMALS